MACKPNSPTWQVLHKMPLSSLNTTHKLPFSLRAYRNKKLTARPVSMQLQSNVQVSGAGFHCVKMRFLDGCKIHIANYWFGYDGQGGEGTGHVMSNTHESGGLIPVSFDMETFHLPDMTSTTANIYGLAFPPFVTVRIEPDLFQGCIDTDSGQVDLRFRGKIRFEVGGYEPPPLVLETLLTTEESEGAISGMKRVGERIGREGKCRLIGVATIDLVQGDLTMNSLLDLPTECVTDLRVAMQFY